MSAKQISTRREAEEMLISKAQHDSAFRSELLANPRGAIKRQLGIDLPADMKITVVEENARSLFLVLPSAARSNELSEQELAGVVGGKATQEAAKLAEKANDASKFGAYFDPGQPGQP